MYDYTSLKTILPRQKKDLVFGSNSSVLTQTSNNMFMTWLSLRPPNKLHVSWALDAWIATCREILQRFMYRISL